MFDRVKVWYGDRMPSYIKEFAKPAAPRIRQVLTLTGDDHPFAGYWYVTRGSGYEDARYLPKERPVYLWPDGEWRTLAYDHNKGQHAYFPDREQAAAALKKAFGDYVARKAADGVWVLYRLPDRTINKRKFDTLENAHAWVVTTLRRDGEFLFYYREDQCGKMTQVDNKPSNYGIVNGEVRYSSFLHAVAGLNIALRDSDNHPRDIHEGLNGQCSLMTIGPGHTVLLRETASNEPVTLSWDQGEYVWELVLE
jgi:hypothetical protein